MNRSVTVIGGSAAGFFSAYLLSRQGMRVKLFEASESINPSGRTLIVTKHLRDLLGPICDSVVTNEINRFELFADGKVANIPLRQPDLVIDRNRLIRALAGWAEAHGTEIRTGMSFSGLRPKGAKICFTVSAADGKGRLEEETDIIIGADGAQSEVARALGVKERETAPLCQTVVELPRDMDPHSTRVWFVPDLTPYFFWLIPHSANKGVLGFIGEGPGEGKSPLERFLERKGIEPAEYQFARIPVYGRWIPNPARVGDGRAYLVGDAAAHVKVSTVGGIVTGLRGVLGVVNMITGNGATDELKGLKRELDRHRLVRKVLHTFSQDDYVRLFGLLNSVLKRSLGSITRDETGKLLCHTVLREPRLLLLAVRALAKKGLSGPKARI